ncbi:MULTISPECIES: carbon storage regulator [unclassified Marinobacterium]|uniref:carbon storage regulator n=1 Tax=unclassified Marinobacterium TaxID=2644139 RepID=UPI001569CA46|nr:MULTISPECIES: carbon storage regulator [unclassified Marinobacterium]NRP10105.1 carbon storage regulator [Marinobacterium sp. xm-g-48]NRP82950.1 carbon storage regulator [Marinobacterium sp. xm-d-509]
MLVLTRNKENDTILIGDNIEVVVSKTASGEIKVAIEAPKDVPIVRKELLD